MKALLLVAHGSRRAESNDEVVALADELRSKCAGQYCVVNAAFLELAHPLIPAGIERCIAEGAQAIRVLPYFLNSGRHVTEDIPNIVNEASQRFPGVDITVAPHIGASPLMMGLLTESAE